MFTGIIQEVGNITAIQRKGDGYILRVEAPQSLPFLKDGGSICINGACQSVITISSNWFEVLATSETVSRTNFRLLQTGNRVNLELPLTLQDPLGGHLVSGHVDDTGKISSLKPGTESTILQVLYKPEFGKYIIEKGSIAIDGISLTVFDISPDTFSVSLILETIEKTNLKFRKIGDVVNLEFDLIGKYVEKFINKDQGKINIDLLKKHGFTR